MSEAKDIPPGTYELEFGQTFSDNKRGDQPQFHTLRYDFKPQSVAAVDSETYISCGANGDVHVAVPTEGDNLTVFKGSKKEATPKECLLFFDKKTGRVRLEKISSNINVKATRDLDKNTDTALRNEMAKLRAARRTAAPSGSHVSTARIAEGDSSSSSSSSGSDSDSGSEDEETTRTAKRPDSTSSFEDMDNELLAKMESSHAPPQPAPVPVSMSTNEDFDMPSLSAVAPPPVHRSSSSSHRVHHHPHGDLGLNLSESSDDDE